MYLKAGSPLKKNRITINHQGGALNCSSSYFKPRGEGQYFQNTKEKQSKRETIRGRKKIG